MSKLMIGEQLNLTPLYGNSYWYADALLGYRFPQREFLHVFKRWDVQLNVTNVFNHQKPLVTRYTTNKPPVLQTYDIPIPIGWALTSNFEF